MGVQVKMAQTQIGTLLDVAFVNRARAKAGSVIGNDDDLATPGNYASIATLDARLIAINNAYYTQARLDQMTANDKVYAVRLNDDAASV